MEPVEVFSDGPGKIARIVIWKDNAATQIEARWGLYPFEPDGRSYNLLRAEGRKIVNPCLIVATEFMISGEGSSKKRHRVTFKTDLPFFCFAGVWEAERPDWPAAFAGLTVEANPDIAPFKDRHLAVVRHEDWQGWLTGSIGPEQALRPHPAGSFVVEGPAPKSATDDLFDDR
jgi:putative SOS response-associated peptidase YedK